MSSLSEVVRALASREGVEAVLVASDDGLAIQHAGRRRLDAETVAALAATLAQQFGRLGSALEIGDARTAVVEHAAGLLVAAQVGDGNLLLVLAAEGIDVGPLLYDLRRHRPALAALL